MRVGNVLLVAFLILQLVGCRHTYTQNETILKAEQLLFTSPDSAYKLLKSIKNPEKLPDADYAAWCLHISHAQYKLYMDIKSDSIIKFSVNYYADSQLNLYSGTSYYLWGCISEILNDPQNAMYAYKKADDFFSTDLELNVQQIKIRGLINYRISNLYLVDEYYSDSEHYINKSIKLFKSINDTKYLAYCYRTRAEIYYRQEKPIQLTLNDAEICKTIALKDSIMELYCDILVFEGKLLVSTDLVKAKHTLLMAHNSSVVNNPDLYSLLNYVYARLNNADSAKYYQQYININHDLNRNLLLKVSESYIFLAENKKDSAFLNYEKAFNLREKIYKENIKEQLIRIDKQYDLSKKEAEKAKFEIQNQKNTILIAFLSLTALAILLILLIITNINKKRQAEMVIEKQQLEFDVKTKQVENDKKLKILHANLQNKIDNTLRFKKLQTNLSKTDKKEEFLIEITRQSVLTDKEWQFYIDEANELFGGSIAKLRSEYPQLTDADTIIIALICLGIDISNSMVLLDYSGTNTMYVRRNRIKKHLGLENQTDLEKWLKNYLHKN